MRERKAEEFHLCFVNSSYVAEHCEYFVDFTRCACKSGNGEY